MLVVKRRFVGIDLGTHSVKVVVVQAQLRGAQVVERFVEPVEVGPDGGANLETAAAVAAAIVEQAGLRDERACVSVPGSVAAYRTIDFPFADARRIAQALPFELEDQFPVPVDRMHHVHHVSRGAGGRGRAWVVAVRRDRMEEIERALTGAGLGKAAVTIAPAALAQAIEGGIIAIPEPEPGGGGDRPEPVTLVVDVGHRTTEMLAIADAGPMAARSVRIGGRDVTLAIAQAYGMTPVEAERAKRRDAFVLHGGLSGLSDEQIRAGETVREALLPLVREIGHTIRWLETEHGCRATRVVLTGAGSRLREMVPFFEERLSVDVSHVTADDLRRMRVLDDMDVAREAVAIGAAVGAATGPLVELRMHAGPENDDAVLAARLRRVGAWAAVFAGGLAIDTVVQVRTAEALLETRRAELALLTDEVLGERITSPKEVRDRLEGEVARDPSELVPERSSLDVMAMIVDAAAPKDEPPAPAPAQTVGPTGAPIPGASAATGAAAGSVQGPDGAPESAAAAAAPPPERGIVWADELVLDMVDIRELKVEIAASAARSSAQDRFAMELESTGCLTNVSKGKVRDQNGRKVFEMNMDNACLLPESASKSKERE